LRWSHVPIASLALRIRDFEWVCFAASVLSSRMFVGLFVPLEMSLIWFPRDAFLLLVRHTYTMVSSTFGARWMRGGDDWLDIPSAQLFCNNVDRSVPFTATINRPATYLFRVWLQRISLVLSQMVSFFGCNWKILVQFHLQLENISYNPPITDLFQLQHHLHLKNISCNLQPIACTDRDANPMVMDLTEH
jgi:hypothetical protein